MKSNGKDHQPWFRPESTEVLRKLLTKQLEKIKAKAVACE